VRLEASPLVDATQCAAAYCELNLRYRALPNDCDGNGNDDSCDIAAGASDTDSDRVLDDCEFARGDFDLDGVVNAADLSVLLLLWGTINPPYGDLNGDGSINAADLAALLLNWGPY
jgi:hypothetical protein